jgi:glycyl-tRNA synthetase beta chain
MSAVDFLVELGTEELPPKSLLTLSQAFKDGIINGLVDAQLGFSEATVYAAPRRLAVHIKQLDAQQPDRVEEKLGPNVAAAFDAEGNPSKAAEGFARSCGVNFADLCRVDTDKGERLAYSLNIAGKPSAELLPAIVSKSLTDLPIAKRMRWGAKRTEFVRPVQWLVMLLDNDVVDCEILGLAAGRTTRGHRFHCKDTLVLSHASEYYETLLQAGKVESNFEKRRAIIVQQTTALAKTIDGTAVIEDDLLDEVTALVEWPVALMGRFEERFLSVPQEALISSMSEHQKYFHLVDKAGALLPYFITIANIESSDPQQIIEGNERVIRPRLSDAAFFFDTDKKFTLEQRRESLKKVTFQQQLGSIWDKTERVSKLAAFIAPKVGAEISDATRAGQLCKSDLVSEMVLEFDNMQGIAGSYYARNDGESEGVAAAMQEQYLPKFAGDALPVHPTGIALALADRIDTMVGIFGIGQHPTGAKDPFALRRAALGVLRIVIESDLAIDLRELLTVAASHFDNLPKADSVVDTVLDYTLERLRSRYQDMGIATEVFMAVQAKQLSQPLDIEHRVLAVHEFTKLSAAQSLAAANKRVSNILAKLDIPLDSASPLDASLLQDDAEKTLATLLETKAKDTAPLLADARYGEVLNSLAELQGPVDAFFDNVMVMADDPALRNNRCLLLAKLSALFLAIADISHLATK